MLGDSIKDGVKAGNALKNPSMDNMKKHCGMWNSLCRLKRNDALEDCNLFILFKTFYIYI